MPKTQDYSAQTVTILTASLTLSPRVPAVGRRLKEIKAVKLLLSVAALMGSLGLLASASVGQAFPYLVAGL